MTLDERLADLRERRLVGLMRRQQLIEARDALTAQITEGDKGLHALDGAIELGQALQADAASQNAAP